MLSVRLEKQLGSFSLDVFVRCGGRVTGIFGPSGSGKTTLLNCVAGLTRPDRGQIKLGDAVLFDDESGDDRPVRERRVGYVFQDSLLFDHMSVRANLIYGHTPATGGPSFDDVVDVLGLGHRLDRRPRELSGGERRRVAVGRALLSNPAILLLDEPLTGLDAALAGRVLVYLKRVLERFEIPAIYVSHSISDIAYVCDEVVVLHDGRAVAKGRPFDVLSKQGVLDDRHLADLTNVFEASDARYDDKTGAVQCRIGSNDLIVYSEAADRSPNPTLAVRASDIILAAARPERISARNILPARVTDVKVAGGRVLVFIDVGATWVVEIGAAARADLAIEPGTDLFAVVKASGMRVL